MVDNNHREVGNHYLGAVVVTLDGKEDLMLDVPVIPFQAMEMQNSIFHRWQNLTSSKLHQRGIRIHQLNQMGLQMKSQSAGDMLTWLMVVV